jgi:hypothetical protein
MKFSQLIMLALFTTTIFTGCKKDTGDDNNSLAIEDLIVKNNEITGWNYAGSSWIANNNSELTQQIDGGSELYFKYGFTEASGQKYSGQIENINNELDLTVYNLSNEQNASGLFDDPDLGLSSAISWTDGSGTRAKYVRNNGLSQELKFYRGKYLVELSITYDTEESLNILKQFAINVDEKLKESLK